jgi:acetylornithine deacetylase
MPLVDAARRCRSSMPLVDAARRCRSSMPLVDAARRCRSSRMMRAMSAVADLLAELVRFPTQQGNAQRGPGDERALCEHLAPLLRARGADDVIVESSVRTDGSPGAFVFARWGTPRRVINAHVDTVPANAGWSREPWDAYVEGGKLFGLGSADTKGAIAATLVAIDAVRASGGLQDIGVLFSGDEEAGSRIMEAFLASAHAAPIEEVIVCEPTARAAGVAHRGIFGQTATLVGPGGHSSRADFEKKPIATLARLAVLLDELGIQYRTAGPDGMKGLCLNIAGIAGGVAFNVIPARGELTYSIRPYPGFDRSTWDREVAALAKTLDTSITFSDAIENVPFACDDLAALVTPFATRIGVLDFWTEAAMWARASKKAIVIGPGDIAQAHAGDEWVSLEDLDWAVDLFRSLLAR